MGLAYACLYRGHSGMIENRMETTIEGLGLRV